MTTTRTINVADGVTITCLVDQPADAEAHTTAVLLPGNGGDGTQYDVLVPHLTSSGFRTLRPHPRGAAGSAGPLNGVTLADLADDVAAVSDALVELPVVVIGRAFGNRVARMLATRRPDLVDRLVLMSAGGLVDVDPAIGILHRRMFDRTATEADRYEAWEAVNVAPVNRGTGLRRPRSWPDLAVAQMRAPDATSDGGWWTGGSAPMLVIQGTEDRMAPVANGHLLAEEVGDRATVVDLPDVGHALLLERHEAVAATIVTWLRT